jgi:hypothetical protein
MGLERRADEGREYLRANTGSVHAPSSRAPHQANGLKEAAVGRGGYAVALRLSSFSRGRLRRRPRPPHRAGKLAPPRENDGSTGERRGLRPRAEGAQRKVETAHAAALTRRRSAV